jgi:hypothetical protein
MNKKQKLQEKLNKVNIKYEIIIEIMNAEQFRYEEQMRKHDVKLRIYSNYIAKMEKEISDLEQSEIKSKYSVEEIESAKELLKNCGYVIAKI